MTTFFAVLTALLGEWAAKYPESSLQYWAWFMFIMMFITIPFHIHDYEKVHHDRTKEVNRIRRFIYLDLFTAAVLLFTIGVIL